MIQHLAKHEYKKIKNNKSFWCCNANQTQFRSRADCWGENLKHQVWFDISHRRKPARKNTNSKIFSRNNTKQQHPTLNYASNQLRTTNLPSAYLKMVFRTCIGSQHTAKQRTVMKSMEATLSSLRRLFLRWTIILMFHKEIIVTFATYGANTFFTHTRAHQ